MKPCLVTSVLALALAAGLGAQTAPPPPPPAAPPVLAAAPAPPPPPQVVKQYQSALDAINSAQWEKASAQFEELAAKLEAARAKMGDASLYWQAFADNKLGKLDASMAALDRLRTLYPDSDWSQDAAALELQLRQATGGVVAPALQKGDDLKLLALNGLMNSNSAEALPMLEKVINGDASPAVKTRALFVLAQNHSPAALQELVEIAKTNPNPEVRDHAVRYLGMSGGEKARAALAGIYAGNATRAMRENILRAYMVGGDRAELLAAAKSETDPELRQEAIRNLALAGGKDELWQLYQSNPPTDAKLTIIRSLGMAGDTDHLIPLAKSESNPKVRLEAIRSLGMSGSPKVSAALVSLYPGASDRDTSRAVIRSLFIHNDAAGLVALARKEQDPELKRDLVQQLSLMHSPAATEYLMEILNH
jgi:HEAT repeat protein